MRNSLWVTDWRRNHSATGLISYSRLPRLPGRLALTHPCRKGTIDRAIWRRLWARSATAPYSDAYLARRYYLGFGRPVWATLGGAGRPEEAPLMPLPLLGAIAAPLSKAVASVVDRAVEDKDARDRIKAALQSQLLEGNLKELDGAMAIIVAEAQGGSFPQRPWRRLAMLTFVGLIVAKWLGFTALGVTEAVELQLVGIVKVGLGGYVV